MTALLTTALDRLATAAGHLAKASRLLADADFLTQVGGGLKQDGYPDHAKRARLLAADKQAEAQSLLDTLTRT